LRPVVAAGNVSNRKKATFMAKIAGGKDVESFQATSSEPAGDNNSQVVADLKRTIEDLSD
jgi:hypothetical protein